MGPVSPSSGKTKRPSLGPVSTHLKAPGAAPSPFAHAPESGGAGGGGEASACVCIIQFIYIIHEASMNLLPDARMQEMVQHRS